VIDCREVTRLRGAFLALELDRVSETEVRGHLAECASCRAELAAVDAAAAFALRLGEIDVPEDASFVSEVLGGIHQRRVERGLIHRRRGALAVAAGLIVVVLGGWALLRDRGAVQPPDIAAGPRSAPVVVVEPAFVEVEGEGVRLYQFDRTPQDASQVVLIVDPQLEL
jgi:hypothetical protein